MTTIARLTKQKDGFIGTLETIMIQPQKIELVPLSSDNEKAPIYRVLLAEMEIGAVWRKQDRRGADYDLVKLDCPTLAYPIFCVLYKDTKSGGYFLEWNRPDSRRSRKDAE
ncbi:MAG: DUF736 domain-containing protein [Terriglobia bacterium]